MAKKKMKIHYATNDKIVRRGYAKGRWPKGNKKSSSASSGGVGADGPY